MKRVSVAMGMEMYEKVKYIAQVESRFVSNQVRYCVMCYIRQFEEKYGEIRVGSED